MTQADCRHRGRRPVDWLGFAGTHAAPVFRCHNPDCQALECINEVWGTGDPATPSCRHCSLREPIETPESAAWPTLDVVPNAANIQPVSVDDLSDRIENGGAQICNPSIAHHDGRLLLAYRRGWLDGRIWLAELNTRLRVLWQHQLRFPEHPRHAYSQEDPRLFECDGALWLSYTACAGHAGDAKPSVMVARLSKRFQPTELLAPWYGCAQPTEKNWTFFESPAGELLSVYQSRPLQVAELAADGHYTIQYRHDWLHSTDLGQLRGGASPVEHDGEFYCWSHGSFRHAGAPWYVATLYTFAATPPYEPRRYCPLPIMIPGCDGIPGWIPQVVYPGGAILRADHWLIAYGYHDHHCKIATFAATDVERILQPIETKGPAP